MLSSRQNGPIQAPEDPETREIVERTAALVGTHGLLMERRLLAVNVNDERYDFLRSREDHPYYDFYRRKVVEHELTPDDEPSGDLLLFTPAAREIILDGFFYLLEDGSDIATSDLHAFVGGIDYFAKRENYEKSALLPQHPSYTFR
ncbi:hypothetical protein DY000_02057414 [Brassica cretica]|uniref:SURP motif domain-containing protein n=1 Tax=Brassica cretica TaxID=69181 RepID=A0ABQ7AFC6_BRACR|nr:hypothetical protein DY000_02057414 [Brassica cretica]